MKRKKRSRGTQARTGWQQRHQRPIALGLSSPPKPKLQFSPTAWAKLRYLRDYGDTEVGGFGITPGENLLLVDDIQLVEQECGPASVEFDDESVADFFEDRVDAGLKPEQFGRIWVHTHPGDCPLPSGTDEETFARAFGGCDWAIMFILACDDSTYARIRYRAGPKCEFIVPVGIDFSCEFEASDQEDWELEYLQNVTVHRPSVYVRSWLSPSANQPVGHHSTAGFKPPQSQQTTPGFDAAESAAIENLLDHGVTEEELEDYGVYLNNHGTHDLAAPDDVLAIDEEIDEAVADDDGSL